MGWVHSLVRSCLLRSVFTSLYHTPFWLANQSPSSAMFKNSLSRSVFDLCRNNVFQRETDDCAWWTWRKYLKKVSGTHLSKPTLKVKLETIPCDTFRCCTKVKDADQSDYRRESHVFSRATTGGNIIKSSRSGSKCTVNTDGSKTSTNSNDDKINLTPCIPIDKWYSLRLVLIDPLSPSSGKGIKVFYWFNGERIKTFNL